MQTEKIGVAGPTHYFQRPDGIIYTESFEPTVVTKEVFIANFEFIKKIASEKKEPIKLLINFTQASKLDKEAKALVKSSYLNDNYGQYIEAVALLSNSRLSTLIGNFMVGISKKGPNKYPIKIFMAVPKAVKWLDQL
ncbi:STAS/SEC14 domain-containing protein [Saprospira grandis]|uniref:DUF7793 family protein n=1 Tax=Saprospira grandis TaxID=1008 RepID=UPI0022DE4216|nr:STAS/SEC14 domain-containing protein [Saprospira grandis]WBM75090.1 STAS/SEC14 domain-containing protein [Saprospira grandis]